jgi:hypothetical protein
MGRRLVAESAHELCHIRPSVRPFVCPSVRLSVRPSSCISWTATGKIFSEICYWRLL